MESSLNRQYLLLKDYFDKVKAGNGKVVILKGKYGSGKSTVIEQLQKNNSDAVYLIHHYNESSPNYSYFSILDAIQYYENEQKKMAYFSIANSTFEEKPATFFEIQKRILDIINVNTHTVIIVEKLNQADLGSLHLFLSIAKSIIDMPVLMIATVDEDRMSMEFQIYYSELLYLKNATEINFEVLPKREFTEFLKLHNFDIPVKISELLYDYTGGNVAFSLKILDYLKKKNYLENNTWIAFNVSQTELLNQFHIFSEPVNLELFTKQEAEILEYAAVIGFMLDFYTLLEVSGYDSNNLISTIESLIEKNVLVENEENIKFAKVSDQQYIYSSIPDPKRMVMHRQVAEILEKSHASPESIAYHYSESDAKLKAYHYFINSGEKFEKLQNYSESLWYYYNALKLKTQPDLNLLLKIANVNSLAGDMLKSLQYYEDALKLADDEQKPQIELNIGRTYASMGDKTRAIQKITDLIHSVSLRDVVSNITAYLALCRVYLISKDFEKTEKNLSVLKKLLVDIEDPNLLAEYYNLKSRLRYYQGELDVSEKYSLRSLELFKIGANKYGIGRSYNNLGNVYRNRDIKKATEYYELAISIFETLGISELIAVGYFNLTTILVEKLSLTQASNYFNRTLAIQQLSHNYEEKIDTLHELAEFHLIKGDLEQAKSLYNDALNFLSYTRDIVYTAIITLKIELLNLLLNGNINLDVWNQAEKSIFHYKSSQNFPEIFYIFESLKNLFEFKIEEAVRSMNPLKDNNHLYFRVPYYIIKLATNHYENLNPIEELGDFSKVLHNKVTSSSKVLFLKTKDIINASLKIVADKIPEGVEELNRIQTTFDNQQLKLLDFEKYMIFGLVYYRATGDKLYLEKGYEVARKLGLSGVLNLMPHLES